MVLWGRRLCLTVSDGCLCIPHAFQSFRGHARLAQAFDFTIFNAAITILVAFRGWHVAAPALRPYHALIVCRSLMYNRHQSVTLTFTSWEPVRHVIYIYILCSITLKIIHYCKRTVYYFQILFDLLFITFEECVRMVKDIVGLARVHLWLPRKANTYITGFVVLNNLWTIKLLLFHIYFNARKRGNR